MATRTQRSRGTCGPPSEGVIKKLATVLQDDPDVLCEGAPAARAVPVKAGFQSLVGRPVYEEPKPKVPGRS